jgi:hypothetical protein
MIKPNSVMMIGHRQVGKTNTIIALKNPGTCHVKIITDLSRYYNLDTGKIAGTFGRVEDTLEMIVKLSSGNKKIFVNWIDTPGERWESLKEWQENYPEDWKATKKAVSESEAVFLILPPHRSLIKPDFFYEYADSELDKIENFPTLEQWKNNLKNWFDFFKQNCSQAKHILISIHKADFFCDMELEAKRWCECNYIQPLFSQYQEQICKQYFTQIGDIIREYNYQRLNPGQQVQFFITTKNNKCLLERPWLYLGSHFQ